MKKPSLSVKRGKPSWDFFWIIYVCLLAIMAFNISEIPIVWFHKIHIFNAFVLFLGWLCLFNKRFQDRLIALKNKLEEKMWK